MDPRPAWGHRLVAFIGVAYLSIAGKTSFSQKVDYPAFLKFRREKRPAIYAFWHNVQVAMAWSHRGEHINAIISQSKDGEYIAQVINRINLKSIRGSTSRGGVQALKMILRLLREGSQVGFTPDGPRGPVGTIHDGVIGAAVLSGAPILPSAVLSRRKITFKSWDRFQLPLPFGHNTIIHGKPIWFDRTQTFEVAKERLRSTLNELTVYAEKVDRQCPSWLGCLVEQICFLVYNVLSVVLLPIIMPMMVYSFGLKRSTIGFKERFFCQFDGTVFKEQNQRLWFHAASLGEWQALKPIIARFSKDKNVSILITTSTHEARTLVKRECPEHLVSLMPIDLAPVLSRWIRKIDPTAVILTETELWPNLINQCSNLNIPVFVINGRLSSRSTRRWRWMKPLMSFMMRKLSYVYARSDEDAANFISLGSFPFLTEAVGNTKSDNFFIAGQSDRDVLKEQMFGLSSEESILVAGSTWPGEEEMLVQVFESSKLSSWRLVLAPRRPERFEEVKQSLSRQSVSWSLWSDVKKTRKWTTEVLMVDTIGDLKTLYGTADIAFIGGSIFPRGGQNPLEALATGSAATFGPHMENFKAEAHVALSHGAALQAASDKDLPQILTDLLQSPEKVKKMGQLATEAVRHIQGASDRIHSSLKEKLFLCQNEK